VTRILGSDSRRKPTAWKAFRWAQSRLGGAKFWTMLAPVSRVLFLVLSGAPLVAFVVGRASILVGCDWRRMVS
jgi:hypothetical protein